MSNGQKLVLICEINPIELACRIFEGLNGIDRPQGLTAAQAMDNVRNEDVEVYGRVMESARRAAEYLTECVHSGKRPQ